MMEIDTSQMKSAYRLNGTLVNGYAGYYAHSVQNGQSALVIVIPHDSASVNRLMQEIDLAE